MVLHGQGGQVGVCGEIPGRAQRAEEMKEGGSVPVSRMEEGHLGDRFMAGYPRERPRTSITR